MVWTTVRGNLRMCKQNTNTTVPLDVVPERRTEQYNSHHFTARILTQQIDLALKVWLHSSVGRASHRFRGGHRFESPWNPDIFRLLPSSCLNWKIYYDDHSSLSSRTAVQIRISYCFKFEATLFYLQQLYFICSNFLICSMSLVDHRRLTV